MAKVGLCFWFDWAAVLVLCNVEGAAMGNLRAVLFLYLQLGAWVASMESRARKISWPGVTPGRGCLHLVMRALTGHFIWSWPIFRPTNGESHVDKMLSEIFQQAFFIAKIHRVCLNVYRHSAKCSDGQMQGHTYHSVPSDFLRISLRTALIAPDTVYPHTSGFVASGTGAGCA